MHPIKSSLSFLILGLVGLIPATLWASYPVVSSLTPNGAQRGTEFTLTITGQFLEDFDSLMFYTPGFEMKKVIKAEDRKVECVVAVAADVPTGKHVLRAVTKSGISHGRQFFIGNYPNVEEKEPNNDLELAQTVGMNQTLEGVVQTEDVDYFKIPLKKGQRITLEVEGLRLGNTLFDPYIAILDSQRFEKASSDDTILHKMDGFCSWVADADGDYYILVRESSYRGSSSSRYRLHVGDFRRPEVVYPAGARAGVKTKVKFVEPGGESFEEEVAMAAEGGEDQMIFPKTQPAPASGNPFRVVAFDNALEVEPNEDRSKVAAVAFDGGIALNGVIQAPGDVDYFKVPFKKGQKLQVLGLAQSLGSPLDPVVSLYDAAGKGVASNDDGGGDRRLDSKFTFDVPADGDYFLRISDHLERGGPDYVYRLEVESAPRSVYFSSPFYTTNDSHYRQFFPVPKGGRFATLVNVTRSNVSGEFVFKAEGLPPGMKLLTPNVPKDLTSVPLLFEAAADAPHGHAVVPVKLEPADPATTVQGGVRQLFEIVRQGVVVYHTEYHDRLPVAVVDEAPFSLEILKPKAPLVADGVMELTVKATRKEGYTKPIRVLMLWKPPGISTLGERTIPEGKDEVSFTLSASGSVAAGAWNFTVLGESDGGKGRIYNASPFCEVKTEPAWITAPEIAMVAVEKGQETTVVAKLEVVKPFEGEAMARLVGMPDTVPVEPVKINKDTKDVVFTVKTTENSPLGKQSNLFVQIDVPTVEGEASIHRVANKSSVRIDAPRKVEPAKVAEAKPKEEKKAPPAPKPLSRLEQLRQEASAAVAAQGK